MIEHTNPKQVRPKLLHANLGNGSRKPARHKCRTFNLHKQKTIKIRSYTSIKKYCDPTESSGLGQWLHIAEKHTQDRLLNEGNHPWNVSPRYMWLSWHVHQVGVVSPQHQSSPNSVDHHGSANQHTQRHYAWGKNNSLQVVALMNKERFI